MKKYIFLVVILFLTGCGTNTNSSSSSDSSFSGVSSSQISSTDESVDISSTSSTTVAPETSETTFATEEQETTEEYVTEPVVSEQAKLEQEAQDRFWEAVSWGYTDEQAAAYADGREIPLNDVVETNAVEEADKFRADFYNEYGREPSSGEMQAHWLKEQGLWDD